MTKDIIFYTDNQLPLKIAHVVQKRLRAIAKEKEMQIVCSSLKKMDFGDINIHFPSLKRGHLTLFKQILAALEHSKADVVFFCEHDVLYHPSHFDFTPKEKDVYYYNSNVWRLWMDSKIATRTDECPQLSGLCGNRNLLLGHYRRRIAKVNQNKADLLAKGMEVKFDGYSPHMGYEPGYHSEPRGVDKFLPLIWYSEWPNVDLRHGGNWTLGRKKPSEFKDQRWAKGWTESDEIPGWGKVQEIIKPFI